MARPPSGLVGSPANQEEEGMDISVLGVDLVSGWRPAAGHLRNAPAPRATS